MIPNHLVVPGTVALLVTIGTFLPLRRMLSAVVDGWANLLAIAIAGMLGTTALLAWGQEIWYRNAVLGILGAFVVLYLLVTSAERLSLVNT